jgi:hypothetical protein
MKRLLFRRPRLALGFLFFLAAGLGIWFDWAASVVPLLMITVGLTLHGRSWWAAWREQRTKPAEPAERVLKWYPSWW